MKQFTPLFLDGLTSEGRSQRDVFEPHPDCTGLAIRVTSTGRKTWTFTYTSPRDQKRARVTIGTYPATTIAKARERAVELRRAVEGGKDPRDETEKTDPDRTVRDVAADYLEMKIKGQDTAADTERRLRVNVLPVVGDVPVREFKVTHLNKVLDPINARGAKSEANHTLGLLCRLFDFAIGRGELERNPITPVKEKLTNEETARTRNLSREEIISVWSGLDGALAKSDQLPDILRLCLITGQRVGEIAGMAKSELQLDKRLWSIPAARVKNDHDHDVPLSDMALAIISKRADAATGDYLFPNRSGKAPLDVGAIDHSVKRAHERNAFNMPKWTPHDLRRTVITQMRRKGNGLDISRFESSLVVNHRSATKENVTDGVYDQNDYLDDKRDALEKWGTFLAGLVAGGNVVPMVRAA